MLGTLGAKQMFKCSEQMGPEVTGGLCSSVRCAKFVIHPLVVVPD